MYIILFNPLSKKGKCLEEVRKFEKKLTKKKIPYETYNLLDIDGRERDFIAGLNEEDIAVIVGGDGTLHFIVNKIRGYEIKCKVFLYTAGSGNDFSRGHKGKFFEITKEIVDLPTVTVNGEETVFINGVGMGIDAAVCYQQYANMKIGKQESYFKIATRIFKKFKKFSMKITIDGKVREYDDVWFAVVQNGKYFGGGMKVAPKAKRDDEHLDICIIRRINVFILLLIFPLIFLGKHVWFKKVVEMYYGNHIIFETKTFDMMQHDGEVMRNVYKMEIRRR